MKPLIHLAAALLGAASVAAPAAAQDHSPIVVAVTADRMVDVLAGTELAKPVVIITDGRISAVGRQGEVRIPAGARHIDLPGRTILPGLIDMHVHLDADARIGGYRRFNYTDTFWTAVGVANAKKMLEAGFTTVRNVGSRDYNDVAIKQAVEGGYIPGPRIVPATYLIGATGGHCDDTGDLPPSLDHPQPALGSGPDQMRDIVRKLHKYGAEVIKICATGGVLSKTDAPGVQQLTLEEMKAIVDEAHRLGLRVAAHAHGTAGINDALRAGVDTIEHASLADEESFRLAKEHGAWFSMDIYDDDYILSEGAKNGLHEESLVKERAIGRRQRETFRAAVRAGVKQIFGTDNGAVFPAGENALQFAKMVEWGMTPLQAVQAATSEAARALNREADVGAIAVGRYGDIDAVDGDPLQDVRTLEHVRTVIKGGEVVKSD
ncbi:MAG TPA: amidohydrolase family protein [Allosphingosinicella sp.]|nr:amidohydrolase family protein [Allosphingosinicella sp.]